MPTQQEIQRYTRVAVRVLLACKKLQPDFYNADTNPEMPDTWGYIFACNPFPELVYLEAVAAFYADNAKNERPGVGAIVHYAKVVRDRWESDPNRRELLRQYRQERQDERDRQIAAGTFRGSRGIVPPPELRQLGSSAESLDRLGEGLGDMPW